MRLRRYLVAGFTLAIALVAVPAMAQFYEQHNLVSDGAVDAERIDPNLINPWGLVSSANGPWWVADNGVGENNTAHSTLYNGEGVPFPPNNPLVVAVPGAPTGIVFNNTSGFPLGSGNAVFIFASEDGTLSAWNGGTQATVVYTSPDDAIYKGLAIAATTAGPRLYATNFKSAVVEVFDGTFTLVPGGFADPTIPAGFGPFGIQTIGDVVYVTYAKQDEAGEDDVAGKGLGYVIAFDTAGNLIGRVASRGQLNAPWGIAWAPDDFGANGHLLIGNFGDGHILQFDPDKNRQHGEAQFKGFLHSTNGAPVHIDGLWALQFGHGNANSGDTDELYFTAGPNDEEDGLFGYLEPADHPHEDEGDESN